jgi:hypothetical protein
MANEGKQAYDEVYRKANRERIRAREADLRKLRKEEYGSTMGPKRLMKTYGCSTTEFAERMATSDCCEVCGSKNNLCYDHDHETMEFRGVLCRCCNGAIGKLGDTLESVKRAVKYLERS